MTTNFNKEQLEEIYEWIIEEKLNDLLEYVRDDIKENAEVVEESIGFHFGL